MSLKKYMATNMGFLLTGMHYQLDQQYTVTFDEALTDADRSVIQKFVGGKFIMNMTTKNKSRKSMNLKSFRKFIKGRK